MKKNLFLMAMAIMALGFTACTSDNDDNPMPEVVTDDKPFPYDSEIDESVRPGDDFYRYALGKWLDSSDPEPSFYTQIAETTKQVLATAMNTSSDPLMVQLRSLVDEAMADDSRSEALLRDRLQMLEQVETADQLYAAFTTMHQLGYSPMVRVMPFVVGREIVNLMMTGGKPIEMDTVMARKNTEVLKEKVAAYCQTLSLLGYSDERIAEINSHALALEQVEMADFLPTFEYFNKPEALTRGAADDDVHAATVAVGVLMGQDREAIENGRIAPIGAGIKQLMVQLMKAGEHPQLVPVFRDYLIYNVISQDAVCVPRLTGKTDRAAILNDLLHYNKYYKYRVLVESYGRDNICKQQCQDIMERMRQTFIRRVDALDWMSDATKAEARKKAEAMLFYIGYPDTWNDAMTPTVSGDCLLSAATQLRQHATEVSTKMLGKRLEDVGWDFCGTYSSFVADNSFHMASANALIILPSWITRPRFNSELSEAALYATAFTFGHEFCHGFDANGSAYDDQGASRDWWAPADKQAFQEKQQALAALYSQLEFIPGRMADGMQTLTEDMADYGGMTLALDCYTQRLTEQGFTGVQMDKQIRKFFLAYAQISKHESELSPEKMVQSFGADIHSVFHNRVNGMMRLQDDWYRLYDVKPTDKLYLAPEQRVKIW